MQFSVSDKITNIQTLTFITQATNIDPLKANAPFKIMRPTTATYRHVVGVIGGDCCGW